MSRLRWEIPPGGGFRVPHWHDDLNEVFYVLEGELEFLLGDQWVSAPAGATVLLPAGTVHAFRNTTDRTARQLISDLGEHPRQQWEAIHERHRSHYAADHSAPSCISTSRTRSAGSSNMATHPA